MAKSHSDKKPAEKLLSLYTLLMLQGSKEISIKALAEKLSCSKPTILRLLVQLEASKYGKLEGPIVKGREHYYRLTLPQDGLNMGVKELMQLNFCRNFLLHILPKEMSASLGQETEGEAMKSAESALPQSFGHLAQTYHKGYIDYAPFEKSYTVLLEAIRKQKLCLVTYKRSPAKPARAFTFAPKRLISYRESISFHGWEVDDATPASPKYDNSLSLYLQRFENVQITEIDAAHIAEPAYAQDGTSVSPFGTMQGEAFRVRLHFCAESAPYIHDRVWSNRQSMTINDDGTLILDFDAQSAPETLSWVLSFGMKAKVLEPQWLRDEVKRQIDTMKHMHEDE